MNNIESLERALQHQQQHSDGLPTPTVLIASSGHQGFTVHTRQLWTTAGRNSCIDNQPLFVDLLDLLRQDRVPDADLQLQLAADRFATVHQLRGVATMNEWKTKKKKRYTR